MGASFTASEDILYYSRIICRSSEWTGACGDIESHFVPSSVTFCPFARHPPQHPGRAIPYRRRRGGIFPWRSFLGPPPLRSGKGTPTKQPDPSQTSHGSVPACTYILISNSKRDLCLVHRRYICCRRNGAQPQMWIHRYDRQYSKR
jgi:hypothetical protein